MFIRAFLLSLITSVLLTACGGSDSTSSHSDVRLLAQRANQSGPIIFSGAYTNYKIEKNADGYLVSDLSGATPVRQVSADARLRFADLSIALDTAGIAGKAYRVYQAAFNRTPDGDGLTYWITKLDQGYSLEQVAQAFVQSDEFNAMYGRNPSNLDVVKKMYQNVLHRDGEATGTAYWVGLLDKKQVTLAQALIGFSESAENKQMVAGAIKNGIAHYESGISYSKPLTNSARTVAVTDLVSFDAGLNGNSLQYDWQISNKPVGSRAVMILADTARASFVPDLVGDYEVTLTVREGSNNKAPVKVSVKATPQLDRTATSSEQNYIYLESSDGDFVGGGINRIYTQANATLDVTASNALLQVNVTGDQNWRGNFALPSNLTQLTTGMYTELSRYPFHSASKGGLDWSGEGSGCNTETGWVRISKAQYQGGTLVAVDMDFEQHCDGSVSSALRGRLHWKAGDTTAASGPSAVPQGLWQPNASMVPASGNYVYVEGSAGDYIIGNNHYTYTNANAMLAVTANNAYVGINVNGDQSWTGDFQGMKSLSKLVPGFYNNVRRYPFNNPIIGGLNWSGNGRGCNTLNGWFAIDSITYSGNTVTALDARFEQHCEGVGSAMHGKIHWSANDTTKPIGPLLPVPAGLWQPEVGSTPASGNYVYLDSSSGDYIGAGRKYTYNQSNAKLSLSLNGANLSVSTAGDESWTGNFVGGKAMTTLTPGYYGDLRRFPFNNPATGGLNWSGEGRGCNELLGWFVIDNISYSNGVVSALDLRFEQHCEGGTAALRGKIHWTAGDTTAPAGPQMPPPNGLWRPTANLPTSGNYVYLDSDASDYIGGGEKYTYTASDNLQILNSAGHLQVAVGGWSSDFQTMSSINTLQPGYYGNLQRYPFNNAVRGGMDWSGKGRGCNRLSGWFVVDKVTYVSGVLNALDLRFEQHCEEGGPALRGVVHWSAAQSWLDKKKRS